MVHLWSIFGSFIISFGSFLVHLLSFVVIVVIFASFLDHFVVIFGSFIIINTHPLVIFLTFYPIRASAEYQQAQVLEVGRRIEGKVQVVDGRSRGIFVLFAADARSDAAGPGERAADALAHVPSVTVFMHVLLWFIAI